MPKQDKPTDKLSTEAKFAIIVETATLSEAELSQYCRERGLFPEQVKAWKQDFIQGSTTDQTKGTTSELQKERRRIKELEQELRRKDKALAETAALLVLRKKANAIWGKDEDE